MAKTLQEHVNTPGRLIGTLGSTYPFLKVGSQRVLGEDVELDLLDAEQEGRLDHGEGLLQTVPTGHHRQVHDLLDASSPPHRPPPVALYSTVKKKFDGRTIKKSLRAEEGVSSSTCQSNRRRLQGRLLKRGALSLPGKNKPRY